MQPQVPDVDAGSLLSVIELYLRPVGTGRIFFLKETRPGVYVF